MNPTITFSSKKKVKYILKTDLEKRVDAKKYFTERYVEREGQSNKSTKKPKQKQKNRNDKTQQKVKEIGLNLICALIHPAGCFFSNLNS